MRILALAVTAAMVCSMIAPATAGAASAGNVSVTTEGATNVTESTATLNGNVTGLENATTASVSFEYWPGNDSANATTVSAGELNESGPFAAEIDGLAPNTTYTAVARANVSGGGTVTGEEVTFVTDDAFDVQTREPTVENESAATLRGELTDLDGAENATVWFEYGPEGENTTETAKRTLNETGTFSATVTGLEENVTYVYAAHAESADGATEAGDDVTFDTAVEEWDDTSLPFGQRLSAYVHSLIGAGLDEPLGQYVSEWVRANSPGPHDVPAHANGAGSSGDERGPPDHANGGDDGAESADTGDSGQSESGGQENGPPDHANGDKGDEKRGNGNGNGNGNDNGNGNGNGNGGDNGNGNGNA